MRTRLNTLKGNLADEGRFVSWDEIAQATGISRPTLMLIAKGEVKALRPEYIDALCQYFGVTAAELIVSEPVQLPLDLKLRPDRKGKKIGE